MPLYRVQTVLRHVTGLPADASVNTFHVEDAEGGLVATAEGIAEAVRDFYVTDPAGTSEPLMNYLGTQVSGTGHEVRVYDIDTETGESARFPGAPPLHIEPFDFVGRTVPSTGEPSEVAVCLSYRNVSATAVPPARRRGRIYFGPLTRSAVVMGEVDGRVTVSPVVQTALRTAATELIARLIAANAAWVIYSRPYAGRGEIVRPGRPTLPALAPRVGTTYTIDEFWTDDAFDTQRRRGEDPTIRTYTTL